MNIILLPKTRKSPININLSSRAAIALLLFLVFGVPTFCVSLGYGVALIRHQESQTNNVAALQMEQQQDQVAQVVETAQYSINALTQRLGQLQAHAVRLDALGKRLVELAKLEKGEFDFENPPAVGGPEVRSSIDAIEAAELVGALEQLTHQFEDREQQLSILETLLMNRILLEETVPTGRPVTSGWVSSHFGKRTDPFTGKQAYHYGVDFAGKEGSRILSVASGVVTWSGDRYGYGTMVEVDHGNGYVTRYGHNKTNLVNVGDVIQKGDAIALMGSSGRSTGPHVHFEVLRNGKAVNPVTYLRASR